MFVAELQCFNFTHGPLISAVSQYLNSYYRGSRMGRRDDQVHRIEITRASKFTSIITTKIIGF